MEKQKKIIDASVGVKWFANEENSDKALDILKEHVKGNIKLIIPELFLVEVVNALRYKKDEKNNLKEITEVLLDYQLDIQKLNKNILNKAIEISLENDFSIYDSIYIAIANLENSVLITADKELSNVSNVNLIKDL